MASSPILSVVVPAFRASAYLARCIESILAQTLTDWELIIVEQSGAGTPEREASSAIVRGYLHADAAAGRIRLIEQENAGASGGRNRGIDESRGEFVAFLDADDEFLPHKLARQVELFRLRPELGLVYGDYAFVDLQNRRHASVFDELAPAARRVPTQLVTPGLHVCGPDFFDHLARQYFIATIVGLVRRDVLRSDVRFSTRHRYAEEWLFYLDVARRARVGFVDEPLCLHHHVAGSVSRTSTTQNLEALADLLEHMLVRFADASRRARRAFRLQLAAARRQLGMEAYKQRRFATAADYWRKSLREQPNPRTLVHWAQAKLRTSVAAAR
ncbi:MAG: glycosyltransferase family 2 protein [Phycisphaerales bacterium]|nr:glycosyltransferase family 2 protein [Phycisphaerales bacterium]